MSILCPAAMMATSTSGQKQTECFDSGCLVICTSSTAWSQTQRTPCPLRLQVSLRINFDHVSHANHQRDILNLCFLLDLAIDLSKGSPVVLQVFLPYYLKLMERLFGRTMIIISLEVRRSSGSSALCNEMVQLETCSLHKNLLTVKCLMHHVILVYGQTTIFIKNKVSL